MKNTETVKRIISRNRYLTLATANGKEVWAAPLAYVFNPEEKAFYFYSARDAKHSRHIAVHSEAAVVIFDSSAPSDLAEGLQFKAKVVEITEHELCKVMDLYFSLSFPDPETRMQWARPEKNFKGVAPQRFYKIVPLNLFVNDVDKKMVDYRREIDLKTL